MPRSLHRGDLFGLAGFLVAVCITLVFVLHMPLSGDVYWHLAAGNWMLAHHRVIGADPFSYTRAGQHWTATEWGSELLLAATVKAVGTAAYVVIPVGAAALTYALLGFYLRKLGCPGSRAAWILVLVAVAIAPEVAQDRGLTFSFVFFATTLLVLTAGRTKPAWLIVIPFLFCVWVNMHGSVSLGFGALGVEAGIAAAGNRLDRFGVIDGSARLGPVISAGAAGIVAICITPYGPHLFVYDVWVQFQPAISNVIAEWQSPNFHLLNSLALFLVPAAVLVAAAYAKVIRGREFVLCVVIGVAALHSERLLPYLVMVAGGLAAALPFVIRPRRRSFGVMLCIMIPMVFVLTLANGGAVVGQADPSVPVAQFHYLEHRPGRVFTEYAWGGYSDFVGKRTFIDGRTDFFVGPVLNTYLDVTDLSVDPDSVLDRYGVRYVVWHDGEPLSEFLAHDPHWKVVFTKNGTSVFEHRSARTSA